MPIESVDLIVPESKGTNFKPLETGMYQVQVFDIKEKMKAPYNAPLDAEKTVPFYEFEFVVLDEGDNRGRRLWKDVKPLAPVPSQAGRRPSKMWEIVSAVEKHPLTKDEGKGYNKDRVNALIGKQLIVFVIQKPPKPDGRIYNDIQAFSGAKADMKLYTAEEAEAKRKEFEAKQNDVKVEDIPF